MDRTPRHDADDEPVERFAPTTGLVVGWTGILVAVLVIGWVLLRAHSAAGLRVALAALFAAVLVWVTQMRPRVTAYRRYLLMRGSLRDVAVPYLAVEQVTMGQTLNVWAGGRRYVCVGIGKSLGYDVRQRMRAHNTGGVLGTNRVIDPSGLGEATPRGPDISYQSFVMTRIDDLVKEARARRRPDQRPSPDETAVRPSYAVPEVVALVVTGVALVASLLA